MLTVAVDSVSRARYRFESIQMGSHIAVAMLVFVFGVSVRPQEWAYPPPIGMGSSVNQYESPRTPIRQMSAMESSPNFWNMPMAPPSANEFVQPSAANHFGQASSQASPLYAAAAPPHHLMTDSCCTSPTTERMAKDIAETLSVLRAIALSLETLNANFNRTIPNAHLVPTDKLATSNVTIVEKTVPAAEPSKVTETK